MVKEKNPGLANGQGESIKMVKLDGSEAQNAQQDIKKSTLSASVFNLTNAAIGAGCLAIPQCFRFLTMPGAIASLILAAVVTCSTLYFLGRIQENVPTRKFTDISKVAFAKWGEASMVIVLSGMLLAPLSLYQLIVGKMTAQSIAHFKGLKAVGDEDVTKQLPALMSQTMITLYANIFLIFPLCCLKNVSKLSKASLFCMFCLAYCVILVVWDFIAPLGGEENPVPEKDRKEVTALRSFGFFTSIMMSYVSHPASLEVFGELDRPTVQRRNIVAGTTSVVALLFYVLIGVSGFLNYGDAVQDLIIGQKQNDPFVIAKLSMAVVLALTLPLLMFPARDMVSWIIERVILPLDRSGHLKGIWADNERFRVYGLNVFILSIGAVIGLAMENANTIMGLFGSVFGIIYVIILPALYFIKLNRDAVLKAKIWEIRSAYAVLGFGIVTWFICVVSSIYDLVDKED